MAKEHESPEYKRARKELLQGNPICHWCKRAPATEADHLIEVDAGGTHLDGLVPSCKPCNAARGTRYLNRKRAIQQQRRNTNTNDPTTNLFLAVPSLTPSPSFVLSEQNQTSSGGASPIETVQLGLGRIQPRLQTPIPGGDSFGAEVAELAEAVMGKRLFDWQVVAISGMLTWKPSEDAFHLGKPELVHRESLCSTGRQSGKSVALTSLILWALVKWPLHRGEPVNVLSVANKLDRAVAIFTELAPHLENLGAKVTWSYGRNKAVMPDGSTWEVRAAVPGLHGMSPTLIVCDEVWNITPDVYFDALKPSQIAQWSPLISSWSTSGDEGSATMLRLREQALANIDADRFGALHFCEWSPPSGANLDDPINWSWANPALGRGTITLEALKAASQTPDRSAWLRAHMNVWVSSAQGWIQAGLWDKRKTDFTDFDGGHLCVDSSIDESKYVGIRSALDPDGNVVCTVAFVADSNRAMWEHIERIMAEDPKLKLGITPSLEIHTPMHLNKRKIVVGYAELLKWTGMVRQLIMEGRCLHTGEQMLAEHINRATLARSQGAVVLSSQKSPGPIEMARCLVWSCALTSKPANSGKAAFASSF